MSRRAVGVVRSLLRGWVCDGAALPTHHAAAVVLAAAREASKLQGRTQMWGPSQRHTVQQLRGYSDGLHTGLLTELSEGEYNKLADHTLEEMLERLEAFVEDLDIDGDVEYSQGVMTIKLGSLGTYVINKQAPNRQIWMSSPVSGPVRYDYMDGQWVYHRDGHVMRERLEQELKQLTGGEIDLRPDS